MTPYSYSGVPNGMLPPPSQMSYPYEHIIKEKQEIQHQLNMETQRRMLLEKEVAELYRL